MLTLWYIVLGWKEYNKSFRRAEQPEKPVEPAKKSDLIPPKKDGPTLPTDIKKPEPPKSIPIDPRPPASRDPAVNNKVPDTPEISDVKPSFPSPKSPEVPKTPSIPKTPEPSKVAPKTPESPEVPKTPSIPKTPEPSKIAPKTPEPSKVAPKTPESPKMPDSPKISPKTPETPKMPEPPKIPPRATETPKMPELKLFPEIPKKSDVPKTPELPKVTPKTPDSPRVPEGLNPSRRPESVMHEFPPGKNPYFPQPNPSEYELPPYLPGHPQSKPLSRDDELFALGNNFNTPSSNKPMGNLRDLSYAKGEFPGEDAAAKVQEAVSKLPKYMEQSVISNPDSLESDEEDEDF